MQVIVSADQMRAYDRTAIRSYAIPGLVLMENAGRGFVDALEARYGSLGGAHVVVLCGKGNNGGDGFVVARHLINRGCAVDVVLLGRVSAVEGDAAVMLRSVLGLARDRKSGVRFREITSARAFRHLRHGEIAVDAILGTGFRGKLAGLPLRAVEWINAHPHLVASVDIPTGVDATSGDIEGTAVRAALTVTMGLAKTGHYIGHGCDASGSVVVTDISIPNYLLTPQGKPTFRVGEDDVRARLPQRARMAHKYAVGKVLILAGSRAFPGAAALCASAALKAGAGAVVLATPVSVKPLLHRKLLEVIVEPLDETPQGTVAAHARDALESRMRWADVVVIGPGLSRHEETDTLLREILRSSPCPLLIDADGLNAIADVSGLLRQAHGDVIITPHAGELSRLTGESAAAIEQRRLEAVRESSSRFRCTVVLKGNPTATGSRDGTVYLNTTGNPGLATIGSGDVLSGLIGGLWAQGMTVVDAAITGVYLHGRSADIGATQLGERSLLAGDVLAGIPAAFTSVGDRSGRAG
jgi:hydroxyethylthiazole kinase-like uncharacterized protein yjeF